MALTGPPLAERQELFDFIVSELQQREDERYPAIRKLRKVLRNQRAQLLALAGVIDRKLADIAAAFELPLQAVRAVCLPAASETQDIKCLLETMESVAQSVFWEAL